MASATIAKKSTHTDMTPFVDVAFLILAFFIMATKFKAPDPVEINAPNSVSSQILPTDNALLVVIDKDNRVFFSLQSQDKTIYDKLIQNLNSTRSLGLTPEEMANFRKTEAVGVSFAQLKSLLDVPANDQRKVKQPGIPVMDSTNNELYYWVRDCLSAFSGQKLAYLIKGDNNAKYPTVNAVIDAFKKNEIFKYNLVTSPEDVPVGSPLDLYNEAVKRTKKPK